MKHAMTDNGAPNKPIADTAGLMEAAVTNPNKHIVDYLKYYCDPANELDYAVLLTGPWGSGKTHLIKAFLKDRAKEPNAKHLFVSLYGVNSFRQIDEELMRQLHPLLSSKGVRLATKFAKAALKATIKFDIDGDGKEDVTLNSNLPEIDLVELFKTPSNYVIIFDDLERCSIKVSDALGYINSFVEHEGIKTVILANEQDILSRKKKKSRRYDVIKEKLVGQTLYVQSSASSAIFEFLKLVRNDKTRSFLTEQMGEILALHEASGTNNLRILKHCLWDFERVAICFTNDHWANPSALGVMLRVIFALSFEVRAGNIKKEQFSELGISSIVRYMKIKNGADESLATKIETKYPDLNFDDTIISLTKLAELLFDGRADCSEILEDLNRSHFYMPPNSEPAWMVAWRGWEISEEEYDKAVLEIEEQFTKRSFSGFAEMLHIFGLRLFFSEIGAVSLPKSAIVNECIAALNELKAADRLEEIDASQFRAGGSITVENRGVTLGETAEFKKIFTHYVKVLDEIKLSRLPARGKALLEMISQDPIEYFRAICANNVSAAPYYNIPVLATIQPRDFVEKVLSVDGAAQRTIFSAFKARYEAGSLNGELKAEANWLKRVRAEFTAKAKTLGPMSRFRINAYIKNDIDPYIAKLPKAKL